ncbi:hypothetical protein HDU93_005401 [Gonapodya sp. JEL0774]|nr:hypothetical protein HDU93_005401 [Gonapodya sp. JEL0774]
MISPDQYLRERRQEREEELRQKLKQIKTTKGREVKSGTGAMRMDGRGMWPQQRERSPTFDSSTEQESGTSSSKEWLHDAWEEQISDEAKRAAKGNKSNTRFQNPTSPSDKVYKHLGALIEPARSANYGEVPVQKVYKESDASIAPDSVGDQRVFDSSAKPPLPITLNASPSLAISVPQIGQSHFTWPYHEQRSPIGRCRDPMAGWDSETSASPFQVTNRRSSADTWSSSRSGSSLNQAGGGSTRRHVYRHLGADLLPTPSSHFVFFTFPRQVDPTLRSVPAVVSRVASYFVPSSTFPPCSDGDPGDIREITFADEMNWERWESMVTENGLVSEADALEEGEVLDVGHLEITVESDPTDYVNQSFVVGALCFQGYDHQWDATLEPLRRSRSVAVARWEMGAAQMPVVAYLVCSGIAGGTRLKMDGVIIGCDKDVLVCVMK